MLTAANGPVSDMGVKSEMDGVYFVVVLRHLGLEREIAVLKLQRESVYAFTPYSLDGSIGLDNHVSLHSSGERHVVSKYRLGKKMKDTPAEDGSRTVEEQSVVRFERPENLKDAVQIYLSGDPLGQFRDLRPAGSSKGKRILLDGEKAGFREGTFVVKIYAVPPGNDECVPAGPDAVARVLHFIKSTTHPWIAIDVYQPSPG